MALHIKLHAKDCIMAKAGTIEEANNIIQSYARINGHPVQAFRMSIIRTKRKRKPFDVECSWYSWETVKDIAEDKIRKGD